MLSVNMSCKLFASGWKVMWSFSMSVCFSNLTIIGPSFLILSRRYTRDTRLDKLSKFVYKTNLNGMFSTGVQIRYHIIWVHQNNQPTFLQAADQRTTFDFQMKLHLTVNSCWNKQNLSFNVHTEVSITTIIHLVF